MKDLHMIECEKCGLFVLIVLDKTPNENTKIICDSCKMKEGEETGFLAW